MTDWYPMVLTIDLVLGLLPGAEDVSLIGTQYKSLPRTEMRVFSDPRLGRFLYSPELDMFWRQRVVYLNQLPDMKFGLTAEEVIVPGSEAIETTIESCWVLCKRAPYGGRKKVSAFYGKSGK